ncbi:FadR family transcriptional regulator [candidate division KSB1 bacterium]|nr:MAG: FadR family transcriptional regulator [candidate division KSB1 bacterium]
MRKQKEQMEKDALNIGNFFDDIKKDKLSNVEIVIERIKTLLIERKLNPGDLLPSENVLSESIGVSRGTIREAMKILSAFGIVEIRRGNGTYIATSANHKIFDPLIFSLIITNSDSEELIQLREMMEVGVIDLIIRNATDHDIEELKAAHQQMEDLFNSGVADLDRLNACDIYFHRVMAKSTRNHLVENIYNFVIDIFAPTINARYAVEVHRKLLEAIIARDRDKAAKSEHEHTTIWRTSRIKL